MQITALYLFVLFVLSLVQSIYFVCLICPLYVPNFVTISVYFTFALTLVRCMRASVTMITTPSALLFKSCCCVYVCFSPSIQLRLWLLLPTEAISSALLILSCASFRSRSRIPSCRIPQIKLLSKHG